jgi:hypothetical protein
MKVFVVLGAIFTVIRAGLLVYSFLPRGGGPLDEVGTLGSSIAGWTLLPMGLVFLFVGMIITRMTSSRARLLATGIPRRRSCRWTTRASRSTTSPS